MASARPERLPAAPRGPAEAAAAQPAWWRIALYAATIWPLTIGQQPLTFVIPYYSEHFGLGVAMLGGLLTAGRIYDLFADVTVAHLSDSYRTRFGRRRPWVIAGLALFVPAMWLLFVPGDVMTLPRYGLALFFFFTSWTMAFIPYLVHGTEIPTTYAGKGAINVAQGVGNSLALLGSYALPIAFTDASTLPYRTPLADALGRTGLPGMATVADALRFVAPEGMAGYGSAMFVIVLATSIAMPFLVAGYAASIPDTSAPSPAERASILAAFRNRVFARFAVGFLFAASGYFGFIFLVPFLLTYTYGEPGLFLRLSLLMAAVQVLVAPLWLRLAARLERRTYVASAALIEAAAIVVFLVTPAHDVTLLIVAFCAYGLTGQTLLMGPFLVAADCADYSRWKTRRDSRAVHISLVSLLIKAGSVSGALLVSLVGLAGIVPSAQAQSDGALLALKLLGLYLPLALFLIGAAIILTHPITRSRHRAIVRRIERRLAEATPSPKEVP